MTRRPFLMRRSLMCLAALLPALAALPLAAHADGYPAKPVSIMVPYPAGGLSDVIARTVNTPLSKVMGQPVIVENLGGASGGIAAQKVLNAPADGYYVFQGSPNELVLAPLANAAIKYHSEDFRLVQMITVNPMVLFARKDLPVSNGDELAAYARKMAADGHPLTYASVGPGSMYHLLGEHLSKVIGATMTHVPYKGGAPAFQDLMGGQVDLFITPYGKGYVQLVQEGKIRAVAALSQNRQGQLPAVPTLNESKALKGFVFDTWSGYFVPRATPEPVVQAIHKALSDVARDATVKGALEEQAMVVPAPLSLAELNTLYTDNTARMRAIARAIGLQPQ